MAKPMALAEQQPGLNNEQELFDEIKATLRTSMVSAPFQLWAANPSMLQLFWEQLRPNFEARYAEQAADRIREKAVKTAAAHFQFASHRGQIEALDLSAVALQEIRYIIDIHHYLNPKILLALCILLEAIQGHRFEPVRNPDALRPIPKEVPADMPEVPPLKAENFSGSINSMLKEIKKTLALPAITTEYLCLALCPSYLEAAWSELKRVIKEEIYSNMAEDLRSRATILARGVPAAPDLSSERVKATGMTLPEIMVKVLPFYHAWPALALNMAILKVGLDGEEAALACPYLVP